MSLMRELEEMPERRLINEVQSLQTSVYVYRTNQRELSEFMQWYRRHPDNLDVWHQDMNDKQQWIRREIARLLHNYVASVNSLVDHTRQTYKRLYGKANQFPDYPAEVTRRFDKDPVVQFVQRLRNILLHAESPGIVFSGIMSDERTENEIGISTNYLKRHASWLNGPAKKYLAGAGDKVDVPPLIEAYDSRINDFYEWFGIRQSQIHHAEFERFAEREDELHLLEIESCLDAWLRNPNPAETPAPSDRGIFHWVFNRSEYEQLEALPEGSIARAEKALQLLREHMSVPSAIENKIRRAYLDPNFFKWRTWREEHTATDSE